MVASDIDPRSLFIVMTFDPSFMGLKYIYEISATVQGFQGISVTFAQQSRGQRNSLNSPWGLKKSLRFDQTPKGFKEI